MPLFMHVSAQDFQSKNSGCTKEFTLENLAPTNQNIPSNEYRPKGWHFSLETLSHGPKFTFHKFK